jgi:hypothetical protein
MVKKDILQVIVFLPGGMAAGFLAGLSFGLLSQIFSLPIIAWLVPLPLLTQTGTGGEHIQNVLVNMIAAFVSVAISSRLGPSFIKPKVLKAIWLLIFCMLFFLSFRQWRTEESLSRAALITAAERGVPTSRLVTQTLGILFGYLLSLKTVFKSPQAKKQLWSGEV